MKKFSIKKLFIFLCLPLLACAIIGSSLLLVNNKDYASASIEYANSSKYINALAEKTDIIQSSYSLDEFYPIMAENQTNSDLCWIYSSQKVLETSFMRQKNVYHNFSEIGSALSYYVKYTLNNSDESYKFINTTGDFQKFNIIAQNIGLIYENIFSNDIYLDLDEDNYENYLYALEHIDTSVMNNVKPINIHDDVTYVSSNIVKKREILKRYILEYGGIFAGIEQGIISCYNNVYVQKNNPQKDNENDGYVGLNHAVCIVGWNDSKDCGENGIGAFRVLNSWGVSSKSFSYFWVPYSYAYFYTDTYGYICEPEKSDVEFVSSSSSVGETFADKFMVSQNVNLSNMFLYGQDVELSYKISSDYDFDKIFVNVYQGTANVTNKFSVEFEDAEKVVKISANDKSSLGEGYVIEFYNDDTFLSSKDFYVFTGTEVSYIELMDGSVKENVDSVLMNNNLASSTFEQTYYIYDNSNKAYFLNFYLPSLRGLDYGKIELSLGEVSITSTNENGEIVTEISDNAGGAGDVYVAILDDSASLIKNRHRVRISNLVRKNVGKIVEINIVVQSKETVGTGKVQNYKFIFYISSNVLANTKNANHIVYDLDGGENNAKNVNRFPNFQNETTYSKFKLFDPTKPTSTFLGWYLDKEFLNPITEIDSSLTGDVVIYARWESNDAKYFDISLKLSEVTSYDGEKTAYAGQALIYGDSVSGTFTFTPEFEHLQTYKYSSKYEFFFNGEYVNGDDLDLLGNILTFKNEFLDEDSKPSLVCGKYTWLVRVTMLVSHQFSITKEAEVEFSINPKQITANFDENTLNYVYDGHEHLPVVSSFNGVFAEDGTISYTLDKMASVNVGSYEYKVVSISNSNYFIDDNQICNLIITKKEITLTWLVVSKVYNGYGQVPTYKVNDVIEGDEVQAQFGLLESPTQTLNIKNVGSYNIVVTGITNNNYKFIGDTSCVFEITPAKLKIVFEDKKTRFTLLPINRPTITYKIEGELFDDVSELNLRYTCEGINATESGVYPIVANYSNSNYDVEIVTANYTVSGYYYVFYKLPDGTEYSEMVEEGEAPKGITKEIYKKPFLSELIYSEELVGNGATDLYITVTVKSYAWIFYVSLIVLGFIIVYSFASKRERRNRMR